jgi:hypothetical protein
MAKWPYVELQNYSNSARCANNLAKMIPCKVKQSPEPLWLASGEGSAIFPGCSTIRQRDSRAHWKWWEAADNSYLAICLSLLRKARELGICDLRVDLCFCHLLPSWCWENARNAKASAQVLFKPFARRVWNWRDGYCMCLGVAIFEPNMMIVFLSILWPDMHKMFDAAPC